MGTLMRAIDWSKTAVGPVETWPQSLRTALSILLETGFPIRRRPAWRPGRRHQPHLILDAAYRDFLTLVASQIGAALAGARALEEAKARAEALAELDRAKTRLFSNVSHEFRTPLTLLLGPTEEAVSSTGGALCGEDLHAAKALEMTSPAIEERRHALFVDVPRGLVVEGDPARLAQVFANLLTNAAKYTPQGRIRVAATSAGDHVEVSAADNGHGIAGDMLPRVFELFTQEPQDAERSQGGLGLGLAIVRSLVEAHGGSVSVESKGKSQGATFTMRLPASMAAEVPEAVPVPTTTTTGNGRRVLLVDDNRDAAELLADSLRAMGHVVEVAYDGPGALTAVERFQPDVGLLDIGLPVMDGFELAERLRQEPRLKDLTLIAVTGYAQEVDRQRSETYGFDAHLAKPIDVHRLDALVRGRPVPAGERESS